MPRLVLKEHSSQRASARSRTIPGRSGRIPKAPRASIDGGCPATQGSPRRPARSARSRQHREPRQAEGHPDSLRIDACLPHDLGGVAGGERKPGDYRPSRSPAHAADAQIAIASEVTECSPEADPGRMAAIHTQNPMIPPCRGSYGWHPPAILGMMGAAGLQGYARSRPPADRPTRTISRQRKIVPGELARVGRRPLGCENRRRSPTPTTPEGIPP